ncbi:Predicted oxidoreductase [Marinobacter gudaonensis]|uniref:Predicted oxidoreductase n=1 Tax=Marinobacter gudaonensis TaxID=375760 RepID=A0A1I6GFL7_9GAMM|nr:aldo/keto reductase [Marinobacter gudaonensis]SFR40969.1 Predicted oxidoreductase [Marinobacter gudaonensis]
MSYSDFLGETPLIAGMMRLHDHPDLCRPADLAAWIEQRLDEGVDTFDHADIYGDGECERLFGDALAAAPALRDRLRIITKTGIVPAHRDSSGWHTKHYRAEADHVTGAIDASLARLRVEQVDTFLIHRPDPLLEADALLACLERAVSAGKIRHIGVSNFLPEQWRWLKQNTGLPLVCNQSELSLSHTAPLFDGTLEAHLCDGLRWLAWSPLAGGTLPDALPAPLLEAVRAETGLCETGLAIAWLRQIPGAPIPVLGSLRADRMQAALKGSKARLPRPLWFALLEAMRKMPVA